ncbi:MAG: hypothetical protein QM653_05285 [Dysgonomonas sp.]|uniref:hypothetical protein n=1 Tax=Dysgonomonas sp. TaxID=1891233 RepID=UPI0039E59E0D
MKKFTWNDLQDQINKMNEEQRERQVCVSISDEGFYSIEDIQFIEDDIYVNIEDNDEIGTLSDLRDSAGDDFDIENYRLTTPKGTPFLWDGF